jgi:hypothetical protein
MAHHAMKSLEGTHTAAHEDIYLEKSMYNQILFMDNNFSPYLMVKDSIIPMEIRSFGFMESIEDIIWRNVYH